MLARHDHRHHAIDAIIVALTDRGLLNKVSRAARQAEERFDRCLLADLNDPWPNFRDHVRRSMMNMVVSCKAEHGLQGQLHDDTAYGVVKDPETGAKRLASRKPVTDLTAAEIKCIGDMKIRAELTKRTVGLDHETLRDELEAYSRETGVRRVRIHKVRAHYEVIRHGEGHQKAVIPKDKCWVDIVETPDGTWRGVGVSCFEANQRRTPRWKDEYPYARHIMRVHKGDLLKLRKAGAETIMRVVSLRVSTKRFCLAEHHQAGDLQKRHNDPADTFRWDLAKFSKLKYRRARLVRVDPAGQVFDPGAPSLSSKIKKPLTSGAYAETRGAD